MEQESVDQALRLYRRTAELVREMDRQFQQEMGLVYHSDNRVAQFDLILQWVIYHAALADGRFSQEEQWFLDCLTDHGDLPSYVKQITRGKVDFSWSALARMEEPDRKALLRTLDSILHQVSDEFCQVMAVVDRTMQNRDCLACVKEAVLRICTCFSHLDGRAERREYAAAAEQVTELLEKRWIYYRDL